jgi:tRNA threonylcarbamoyladenosine modification (KEOPS) complex  Pcc1 subunit
MQIFTEAQTRLSEAEKQLSQANLVISEIKNETIATKKVLKSVHTQERFKNCFERALAAFRSKERQIFLEIKQQIISSIKTNCNSCSRSVWAKRTCNCIN